MAFGQELILSGATACLGGLSAQHMAVAWCAAIELSTSGDLESLFDRFACLVHWETEDKDTYYQTTQA